MKANAHASKLVEQAGYQSPFQGLVYRALVYVKTYPTANTPVYFVAGVDGGPWGAAKGLQASHKKHGGDCFYCKKPVLAEQLTLDHIEPVCLGGKSSLHNLVVSCKPCNAKKGHQIIDAYNPSAGKEWLQALHRQIEQRLDAINPPSSTPPPSPRAADDP